MADFVTLLINESSNHGNKIIIIYDNRNNGNTIKSYYCNLVRRIFKQDTAAIIHIICKSSLLELV